jgi:hypothetical protein
MFPVRNARLRGAILATAFASSMAVAPMAHAGKGESFNNIDLSIQGGDAKAVAVCVNFAKTWVGYDDAKRKKLEKKRVIQANYCANKAVAEAGDVTLTDVDIILSQQGKRKAARNDVSVDISGGDATAVAACLNVLQGTATTVKQENDCENTAVARGGNVTMEGVAIVIDQQA